jgi:threonylcarbamoyladenosine tRNA methylthiotransferase MtaB
VTEEATKEAMREIRKIKRNDPKSIVVVTGCSAQVDKDKFEPMVEVDLVVANSHKGQLEELIHKKLKGELESRVFHSNIFRKDDLEAGGGIESDHTRSFLKIQDGCNSFCTYCVIPFARGKSRSVTVSDLVERVNKLYDEGIRETVLTGVHIGDYEDQESLGKQGQLEDLLENLLSFTKMPRFRLSSLEPIELSDRLLSLYQDNRMCPHFHMSIQSANSKVLSDMKRKYTAEDVEVSLNKIKSHLPNAFVGMDVIVGFPGETEEEFFDTYRRLAELPWTRIHVFPYSSRPGTKAALRSDLIERSEILRRSERLKVLSRERYLEQAKLQIGTVKEGLRLQKPSKGAQFLTRDYWPVYVEDDSKWTLINEDSRIEITGYRDAGGSAMDGILVGKII